YLDAASAAEFLPAQRAQARVRLAHLWTDAADRPRAVSAWQSILDDAALRDCRVEDLHGTPQSAGPLAAAGIRRIVEAHGTTAYAAIEERARQRLKSAGKDRGTALRELARQYPNAAVTVAQLNKLKQTKTPTGRFSVQPPTGSDDPFGFVLPLLRAWEIDLDASE